MNIFLTRVDVTIHDIRLCLAYTLINMYAYIFLIPNHLFIYQSRKAKKMNVARKESDRIVDEMKISVILSVFFFAFLSMLSNCFSRVSPQSHKTIY